MSDKDLLNYIYASLDRIAYENAGFLKNAMNSKFEKTEEGRDVKIASATGYGIDQLEHITKVRFAIKEMHLRILKNNKARYHMSRDFEKLRGERAAEPEVDITDLWQGFWDEV